MSEDTSPAHPAWGSRAACSHSVAAVSEGRSGPAAQIIVGRGRVCSPQQDGGVLRCGSPWRTRGAAPRAPLTCPPRAHNVGLPRGHRVASDAPRRGESALQVLREAPRQVPIRMGVLLQGTAHAAEGGHEVPARARGRVGAFALRRSAIPAPGQSRLGGRGGVA